MKLKLKIACDPFETVRALHEGAVAADGIELDFQPEMTNPVRHRAMARDLAFDICELNVCTYLIAKEAGVPITALPIFLFRKFRHGNVFVNPSRAIRMPADLIGARIGCPTLQPASNVWISGILQDEFGVPHRASTWVVERGEDITFTPPPDLRIEQAPAGQSAVSMLLRGEIDALMTPQTPQAILDGDPRIARLFPDYVERERDYFARTGLFPIMHVTAIKSDLIESESWIAASLMAAFEAAKSAAYHHFAHARTIPLVWFGAQWEEDRRIFGDDPWQYGLGESNRRNLEAIIRYTQEQGLTKQRTNIDDLFVKI